MRNTGTRIMPGEKTSTTETGGVGDGAGIANAELDDFDRFVGDDGPSSPSASSPPSVESERRGDLGPPLWELPDEPVDIWRPTTARAGSGVLPLDEAAALRLVTSPPPPAEVEAEVPCSSSGLS